MYCKKHAPSTNPSHKAQTHFEQMAERKREREEEGRWTHHSSGLTSGDGLLGGDETHHLDVVAGLDDTLLDTARADCTTS